MIRHRYSDHPIRQRLVSAALQWERSFGVIPRITSEISEFDAAMLVGHTPETYGLEMQGTTAVRKGFDFRYRNCRYQIKANRPSGKPGSAVTLVGKARNYDWDILIWVHFNEGFDIQECWCWAVDSYQAAFDGKKRLRPEDMRLGRPLG